MSKIEHEKEIRKIFAENGFDSIDEIYTDEVFYQLEKAPELALKYAPIMFEMAKYEDYCSKFDNQNSISISIKIHDKIIELKGLDYFLEGTSIFLSCTLLNIAEKLIDKNNFTEQTVEQMCDIKGRRVTQATAIHLLSQYYEPLQLINVLYQITQETALTITLIDAILTHIDMIKDYPVEWWLPLYTERT